MNTRIKLLIIILSIFIFTLSASAQAHLRRSVYGDFFGGATFASMDIEGADMYKKNKIGFMIGANANIRVYESFHIQTGMHLIKKGSLKHQKTTVSKDGPIEKSDIKQTVDANYVQVPLTIGFEFPLSKMLRINAFAGGYGAFGFKGDRNQKGYTVTIINDKAQDPIWVNEGSQKTFNNSGLKKWDYGLTGSIGLVYDIFILRFQYDHGLADVATDLWKTQKETGAWKTRNYALCLGFRF